MVNPEKINIADFKYDLSQERIAQFPMDQRDRSKLLIYQDTQISEDRFDHIDEYLPEQSLLVFNNTRVIRARLIFFKSSGARIEIFCLEPAPPTGDFILAFENRSFSYWKCLIGNSKKWKTGSLEQKILINGESYKFSATRISREGDISLIKFQWEPADKSFATILEQTGNVPLPPYMNREAESLDSERYQTIYAKLDGSVAAPTAGLHFTDKVFRSLEQKNISRHFVTLHVTAGTFRPVKSPTIKEHEMHVESIMVTRELLKSLKETDYRKIIPVGTTSLRTLESIYWYGVKLAVLGETNCSINQWDPYQEQFTTNMSHHDSISTILSYMDKCGIDELHGETRLIIIPGYKFRMAGGLITNFHMPGSTLLLLVAAMVGDNWKQIYQYALDHQFRFLSYGDSCLFLM